VIGKQISSLLVVIQPNEDSSTFIWCVQPLHMHRRIILCHNLVTEIKEKLTNSQIGTQIACRWDMMSKIAISLSDHPVTQEPSPFLCPNPNSIWWLAWEAICRCKYLRIQQATLSEYVMIRAPVHVGWWIRYAFVGLELPGTWRDLTNSWSSSPLRHLPSSGYNIKTLHKPSKWCGCRWGCTIIHLWFNKCPNHQFGCPIVLISSTEHVGTVLPSRLCQFVNLDLHLPTPLHALMYRFGDCALQAAGFVIFSQLAKLCIFCIPIFPILLIVGTCKITQTVSNSNHHLRKCFFVLSGHQSLVVRSPRIILLLLNYWLWVFNWLSCHSSFSIHTILDPLLFLFCDSTVHLSSFLHHELLFGSQAAQFPKGSNSFCFQAPLALIRLMML